MRSMISTTAMAAAMTAIAFGCASDKTAKSDAHAKTSASGVTGTKSCVMQAGGHEVLRLTVAGDASCNASDGMLKMESQGRRAEVWLVQGAHTVDEATGRVPAQITDEFKDFKAASTTPMTVAGSPAKRMAGTGTEADDGDAGDAEVVVFKTGDNIFIACTHGEGLGTADKQWMLTVVQTAQKP